MNSRVIKFVAGGGKTTYSQDFVKNHPGSLYLAYTKSVVRDARGTGLLGLTIDSFFTGYILPKVLPKIPLAPKGVTIRLNDDQGFRASAKMINFDIDGSIRNQGKLIPNVSLNTPYSEFVNLPDFKNKINLGSIFKPGTLHISHVQRDQLTKYAITQHKDYILEILSSRFSYIIIDEAQDIKEAKGLFAQMLFDSDIQTILLGDDSQNINGGSDWFEKLTPDESKTKSFRCCEAVCEWIYSNLGIEIRGVPGSGQFNKIGVDDIAGLDDGKRVLLYKTTRGNEDVLRAWSGDKQTIQSAKGSTIREDVVIVGKSLSKKNLYTAATRSTKSVYCATDKYN